MPAKFRYNVKRFARMLTAHADKRVTFQDNIDLRNFVFLKSGVEHLSFDSLADLVVAVAVDAEYAKTGERESYWPALVESGGLLVSTGGEFISPPVKIIAVNKQSVIRVEFELNPDNVARWLAATGFPQISRAKEVPDAESDVSG